MGGVIHVGAWTGEEYIGATGRLLLFEPQAEAFRTLRVNCPHAELVNAACGAETGTATMNTAHPSHSSSLLPCTGDVFAGTETVEVTTVDDHARGRRGYGTLRIDTQGYELEVLRGATATLRSVARVELEVHDPHTYRGAATRPQLDEYLAVHGFARTSPDGHYTEVVYEKEINNG